MQSVLLLGMWPSLTSQHSGWSKCKSKTGIGRWVGTSSWWGPKPTSWTLPSWDCVQWSGFLHVLVVIGFFESLWWEMRGGRMDGSWVLCFTLGVLFWACLKYPVIYVFLCRNCKSLCPHFNWLHIFRAHDSFQNLSSGFYSAVSQVPV